MTVSVWITDWLILHFTEKQLKPRFVNSRFVTAVLFIDESYCHSGSDVL